MKKAIDFVCITNLQYFKNFWRAEDVLIFIDLDTQNGVIDHEIELIDRLHFNPILHGLSGIVLSRGEGGGGAESGRGV